MCFFYLLSLKTGFVVVCIKIIHYTCPCHVITMHIKIKNIKRERMREKMGEKEGKRIIGLHVAGRCGSHHNPLCLSLNKKETLDR